jgi:hypothetical protein
MTAFTIICCNCNFIDESGFKPTVEEFQAEIYTDPAGDFTAFSKEGLCAFTQ